MVTLREYETRVVEGVRLSAADRVLCAAEGLATRLRVRELAGGRMELTAGPCVGVVRLDACEIRVLPKYLGEELDVLRMLEYAAGRGLPALDAARTLREGAPHLRDLVALLVTEHCERLLARGVRRDYVSVEDELPVVRGRLLVDRQVLRHYGRLDRLACRFDEHDTDIVDNRLCAAAVDLAARTASSPAVRSRARRAAARFAGLAPTRLGDLRVALASLGYHRHNAHYEGAHRWAALLLSGGGITDLFAAGPLPSRAFLVDMNVLFESFATRLLREAAAGTGFAVRDQARLRGVLRDDRTGRHYSEVRPDILISGSRDGETLTRPVDVKYKLYDGRKLSTPDLYQAFLYAHALARQPGGGTPTCVLLHPGGASAARESVTVRRWDGSASARVRSVSLDLPSVLDALGGAERGPVLASVFAAALG
ncbi:McrC family protein [Streptomyces sp. BV286]|uniref:McrC family protein n=1 Tax=Streptomyces sp. BV286 TaxID=2849672 RepID=UPI001C2ECEA6|nr:McrC family protein [Streptomyces sp. BV286]MBV1940645.1 McrC family protein [Streptomyces sp. BV286]